MSFNAKEISTRDGRPVEFVEFKLHGSNEYFRYTNAVEKVTFESNDFLPSFLIRSNIAESQELENSKLTITVDRDSSIVELFVTNNVANIISVKIWKFHFGDSEIVSYWQGIVSSVMRSNVTADIICDSPESDLDNMSLKQQFQPTCRKFLGDGRCPVPLETVKVEGVVDSHDTTNYTITVSEADALADGHFKFGYVKVGNDRKFIVNHVGGVLTLIGNFGFNPNGLTAKIYPGCNYTQSDCINKYGAYTENGRDFGGFYVSIENYFEKGVGR